MNQVSQLVYILTKEDIKEIRMKYRKKAKVYKE